MCSCKTDLSCRGLPSHPGWVRMWMEGKGQLSGAALSWGLEGCVARKWHCANVGGPLPLNYKQILPGNKSTLCSGPALPPTGYLKCGSCCQQLLLARAGHQRERNVRKQQNGSIVFEALEQAQGTVGWDRPGGVLAIANELYQ